MITPILTLKEWNIMVTVGLLATLQAKPDKAEALADMLKGAIEMAQEEQQTITWYAWQMNETTFGIFDTFEDEAGRDAHLNGKIAAALMEHADELLSEPPKIEKVDILAAK